jgi:hypothetical protein
MADAPALATGEWTFPDTPLGMVSAYSTTYLPFHEGHAWPEAAALAPATFYQDAPETYSENPAGFHQWWQNVSDWAREAAVPK